MTNAEPAPRPPKRGPTALVVGFILGVAAVVAALTVFAESVNGLRKEVCEGVAFDSGQAPAPKQTAVLEYGNYPKGELTDFANLPKQKGNKGGGKAFTPAVNMDKRFADEGWIFGPDTADVNVVGKTDAPLYGCGKPDHAAIRTGPQRISWDSWVYVEQGGVALHCDYTVSVTMQRPRPPLKATEAPPKPTWRAKACKFLSAEG